MLQERNDDHWQVVARYADKLVQLVIGDETDRESAYSEIRDCCLMLAAWYQLNGLHDRAMQCVRSDVTLGIDLLSDTDPDNDTMAWHILMDALLAVGDTTRAIAAVNMLRSGLSEDLEPSSNSSDAAGESIAPAEVDADVQAGASNDQSSHSKDQGDVAPPPRNADHASSTPTDDTSSTKFIVPDRTLTASDVEEQDDPTVSDNESPAPATDQSGTSSETEAGDHVETKPIPEPGTFFTCDGCCFESILNNAAMWRCSYCITDFCESCHVLVKNNEMSGWNVCDSLHHHVPIPGIPVKYPKDMIKVGDVYKPVADWVMELREEWGYHKSST